jgi:hypothetical protein
MTELYGHIIRYLMPGLTKGEVKRLRQFAEEKEVLFIDPMLEFNLRGIYASMVRHERTAYDDVIAIVGKAEARLMIKEVVERKLKDVAKHSHKTRNRRYK